MKHRKKKTFAHAVLATAVIFGPMTGTTHAQLAPDAGRILQQQQRPERRIPDRLPAEEKAEEPRAEMKPVEGVAVPVKAIRFSGHEGLVAEKELHVLAEDAVGQELDFAALQGLADRITEFLKKKGYFLARAYLPKQDVTEGEIEIAVLPGRLEGREGNMITIKAGEGLRISEDKLQAMAGEALAPGEVARLSALERALLLMNDLPGVTVRSTLEPGSTPGTSRLVVEADEGPRVTGVAWADNFGNRYNGAARANLLLNLNDPLRIGDLLSGSVTVAEDLRTASLAYSLPLGSQGLRFTASILGLHYEVGKELASARLEGSAETITGRLSYPLVRGRRANLHVSLGYEKKFLVDEAAGLTIRDKRVDDLLLGFSGDRLDTLGGGGLTGVSAGVVTGDLDLSREPADFTLDRATARTHGHFSKLTYQLGRLQKLPAAFTLYAGILGQFANQNLDSSEEFSLGGPTGVRAYPVSEASGDEGWLANFELRYDAPWTSMLGNLQFTTFFDTGNIEVHEDPWPGAVTNATGHNRYQLNGWGLGCNLFKLNSHALRLTWARTIGDNDGRALNNNDADGRRDNDRFWLMGSFRF